MNLEAIEQRTLSLLKQAMNPLVPFDTLVEHLRREEELGEFSNAELLDFLRHHELFEVVEPLKLAAQGIPEAVFADAGLRLSPHVILNTRVPTERQMAEQMGRQLRSLADALSAAMAAAKEQGQPDRAQALIKLLARTEELHARVARFA
ncbi:MAG TPA: hypothetical protein PLM14_16280 [Candidatus Hydrogenedentes bacterium]|nr:hypothetical protein [Candidatus Hydrogenedentota bacterium]HQE84559.1 hypothetical protein [Candidatus Hydrogenedentota bacterium]HQH51142.1 hypothetical protein [Candidatus Hydrogenedentota bacterium]HQM47448.1 hypothetical protein [Candidatus Hydrogenedentota bacterium]